MRFTDATAANGLVASAARPGRVAGCGLSGQVGSASVPIFTLSEDAGRTWQRRVITGAQATKTCYLFADAQQQDTFVAVWINAIGAVATVTSDAGRTWHDLAIPGRFSLGSSPLGNHLVAGRFFALIQPEGAADFHLAAMPISGAGWQILDKTLSGVVNDRSQLVFAVDPENPATLYAETMSGQALTIVVTHDSGATWHTALTVPSAHRLAIWTAHRHQVFVEQLDGQDAASQFFSSVDGGGTWKATGLHYRAGGELMYVGADGHILTQTSEDAARYRLFLLDPITGVFSSIGTYALGAGPAFGVVVEGAAPAFIYAKLDATYRLALGSVW